MGGGLSPSLACLAVEQGRALAGLFRKGTRSRELTWLMLTRATGAAPHRSGATLSVLARQGDHVGGLALQQRQQRGDLTAQLADLALLLAELGRELLTERRNVFADRLADDLSPELRQLAISRRRGRLVVLSVDLVHEVMRRSRLSLALVLGHFVTVVPCSGFRRLRWLPLSRSARAHHKWRSRSSHRPDRAVRPGRAA